MQENYYQYPIYSYSNIDSYYEDILKYKNMYDLFVEQGDSAKVTDAIKQWEQSRKIYEFALEANYKVINGASFDSVRSEYDLKIRNVIMPPAVKSSRSYKPIKRIQN